MGRKKRRVNAKASMAANDERLQRHAPSPPSFIIYSSFVVVVVVVVLVYRTSLFYFHLPLVAWWHSIGGTNDANDNDDENEIWRKWNGCEKEIKLSKHRWQHSDVALNRLNWNSRWYFCSFHILLFLSPSICLLCVYIEVMHIAVGAANFSMHSLWLMRKLYAHLCMEASNVYTVGGQGTRAFCSTISHNDLKVPTAEPHRTCVCSLQVKQPPSRGAQIVLYCIASRFGGVGDEMKAKMYYAITFCANDARHICVNLFHPLINEIVTRT